MWERLVGQETAVAMLRGAIDAGRVGHAYLFAGPEGVGRELAARALAAALNCPEGGCGTCGVCARIARGAHPDVWEIHAQGEQILVEQVREVRQAAYRSPVEGRAKVFVLQAAHRLNPSAANALLKVLEEPPSDVVFVLVSGSPEDLLPTLVSRCRRVDFFPLGPGDVARILVEQHDADPGEAEAAARTGGNVARALLFLKDASAAARRARHVEIPGRLVKGGPWDAVAIAAEIEAEAEAARDALAARQKDELATYLDSFGDARGTATARKRMEDRHKRELRRAETVAFDSALADVASFYRDALLLGAGAPPEVLVNAEMRDRLGRAAAAVDRAWLVKALGAIEQTRRALQRSAQPLLALEALFMMLGRPRASKVARA